MMRSVTKFLAMLLALYVGLCALLLIFQRSLIYFPQPARGAALPTVALATDGARVLISVRPSDGQNAVIYFGGNAEDVSYSFPTIAAAFPDQAVYLMHYRGYGGSTGEPSESALFADAVMLFDKISQNHATITVVGRSLGSGVAIHLASIRPVARLVLVTPYNSIQELAERQFPYFPVRWILKDKFESWRYAGRVTAPTLLVAAEHDEVIARESTEALQSNFSKKVATLVVVPGAGHNTIANHSRYAQILRGVR